MHESILIVLIVFFGIFFAVISLLHFFSKIVSLPYVVSLLIFGLLAQFATNLVGLHHEIALPPDFIFYVILPLLLFDSAIRINFHQFQLHFRTITFLTTFGLLVSVAIVGVLAAWISDIPLIYGLLFGAIISATDPIAVVAIFKSLRAPKRLSLIAEGESMFNDATAVIAFRALLAIAVGAVGFESSSLAITLGNFIYVFIGSLVVGACAGYLSSKIIKKIDNDHIIETTITVALALSVFIITEHFLHMSGVIATVMAGIILGNYGRTAISRGVVEFIDNLWEYIAFLGISLVFFFSTYSLDLNFFLGQTYVLAAVVVAALIARALSVYLSFFITNRVKFFRREPNVPMAWQHILNWGGLRGVIPLVLVYSLPSNFIYKNEFISFTLGAFLFSLFVNGTTIKTLLMKLGIHIPKKEEEIIREEEELFETEETRRKLGKIANNDFVVDIKKNLEAKLLEEERRHKETLLRLSGSKEFLRSLKYQALQIERDKLDELFEKGFINESVYFVFETQLDIQFDSLEFPEVTGGIKRGGLLPSRKRFSERMVRLEKLSREHPLLARISESPKEILIKDRIALLKTRLATCISVLDYTKRTKKVFAGNAEALRAISIVENEYKFYVKSNKKQMKDLSVSFRDIAKEYEEEFVQTLLKSKS